MVPSQFYIGVCGFSRHCCSLVQPTDAAAFTRRAVSDASAPNGFQKPFTSVRCELHQDQMPGVGACLSCADTQPSPTRTCRTEPQWTKPHVEDTLSLPCEKEHNLFAMKIQQTNPIGLSTMEWLAGSLCGEDPLGHLPSLRLAN